MPLFINKNKSHMVYTPTVSLKESNQNIAIHNPVVEFLQSTQAELKKQQYEQAKSQSLQWNEVNKQLDSLKSIQLHQNHVEDTIIESIAALDEKNSSLQAILQHEAGINEEVASKILLQNQLILAINERLEQHESTSSELSQQLKSQQRTSENFQAEVLDRMDKQEGLTEKMLVQLNTIRSIIFERTNFLASKIEEGYKLTSSYVYKLMTGSEHPMTFYMLNQNQANPSQHGKPKDGAL